MQIFADKVFKNPIDKIVAFDKNSFLKDFLKIEKLRASNYLLGYIRYDAREIFAGDDIKSELPLLYFEVYDKFDAYEPASKNSSCEPFEINAFSDISFKTYSDSISRIKQEISRGNTYQVNYTYNYKVFSERWGLPLFESLLKNQKTPYNAFISNEYEEILSFSPELFFEVEGNKILTKPMKGTVKRSELKEKDLEHFEFLKNDEKNRSENVMIVDLLRNDLGKIAKTASVSVDKLFEVETHKTVHQMTSEVSAELLDGLTLYELFEALFPCGSITGAPKVNTMQIIEDLEVGKRDVYCGAIGLISPDKITFSVPIRILQRTRLENYYNCRVGGGIVWDSKVDDEWEETLTKIGFLGADIQTPDNFKIIETILVQNSEMKNFSLHAERMKKSANELGFNFNSELYKIKSEKDGILRILLSKDGSFTYKINSLNHSLTNKVSISPITVDSSEKMLRHKTTYRPWYEKAIQRIKNGELFDEIFLNEKGEVTEGARSNIVIEKNGVLYSPPLSCGVLPGVQRSLLKNDFTEKVLRVSDLKSADKIFCINSIRGIVEVELV